jgi:hypothetical protein
MGRINSKNIVSSFSGKLGDQLVFRQIGTRAFFSMKGINTKAPSAAQNENRKLFAEAQFYAYRMLQDPNKSEWYSIVAKVNGLRTAQLAAIKDYRSKPEIETLNTNNYKGNIGDVIHIKPKMLLKIEKIEITIHTPDGSVLETGLAVKTELNWKYHATVFNAQVEDSRVVVVTYDRLGKSCRVMSCL